MGIILIIKARSMESKETEVQKEISEEKQIESTGVSMTSDEVRVNYIVQIDDLISQCGEETKIPFIWNGITKGSFGYIFGPAKSGKTILCENLGLSLAANSTDFFGYNLIQENNTVLFISLEEFWKPRTERNAKQIKSMKIDPEYKLNYYVVDDKFPRHFSSTKEWEILYETISSSSANIVFIDSLTRMIHGEIENSSLCREASIVLRDIVDKTQITLIVIHHTPKQSGRPITIESLAGSRVLGQEADFLIGINRGVTGIRYLKEVGFRYKQENDEMVTTFDITDNLWIVPVDKTEEYKLLQEHDRRVDDKNYNIVLNIIKINAASNKGIINSSEIEKIAVITMARSTYFQQIDKMIQKGLLIQESKGRYVYTPLIE
jgi:predicted ATP-dependent serine protease